MWRARFAAPRRTAPASGLLSSALGTPPWYLSARTVATSTTAAGFSPA